MFEYPWTVLGLDTSAARTGFAVEIVYGEDQFELLEVGVVKTKSTVKGAQRLYAVYQEILGLWARYTPDQVALEGLRVTRSAVTSRVLSEIIAAVKIAVWECSGDPVWEVHPGRLEADARRITGWKKPKRKVPKDLWEPDWVDRKPTIARAVSAVFDVTEFEENQYDESDAAMVCFSHWLDELNPDRRLTKKQKEKKREREAA